MQPSPSAMAEVLGVIASVVGIASAGVALATRLHEVVDQFGSTFDDIEVIAIDLNGFSIVLDELSKKLNAPDSNRTASNQLIRGIRTPCGHAKCCSRTSTT